MSLTAHPGPMSKVAAACGAVVLLLGAAACGNSGDNDANGPTGEQGGPQTQQQGGPNGTFPGANGKVAAVADSTAQVQGMNGQVAVTWTGSTTFTKEVVAALSDVKVGDCVFVGSDQHSSGSTPPTEVTATTVRIMSKTNGSCSPEARGPGGGPGAAPRGSSDGGPELNGTPPSGAPDGAGPTRIGGFGGAAGEVTAVSASGFTVASMLPNSGSSGGGTASVSVAVGSGTTYTTTAKGAAPDVKVGVCVAATGTTDDTGAVTASTIAVSQPQDGQCGGLVRFKSSNGGTGTAGSGTASQES